MKRHHVGPAKTRVLENGVIERVPQDAYNPDGWREITEGMRRRGQELGLSLSKWLPKEESLEQDRE